MNYLTKKRKKYGCEDIQKKEVEIKEIIHEVPKAEEEKVGLVRSTNEERVEIRFGGKIQKIKIPTDKEIMEKERKINERILKKYKRGGNPCCSYLVMFRRLKAYPERFFQIPVTELSEKEAIEEAKKRLMDVLFDYAVFYNGDGNVKLKCAKKNHFVVPMAPEEKEELLERKSSSLSVRGSRPLAANAEPYSDEKWAEDVIVKILAENKAA